MIKTRKRWELGS